MQMSFRLAAILASVALLIQGILQPAHAAGTMLDQVLISRRGDTATLEVKLECRNRYIDSFPLTKSERVQINFLRVDECGLSRTSTPRREIQRPVGREMASLKEMEFIRSGKLDAHIPKIIDLYGGKCRKMIESIEKWFPEEITFTRPEGGLFLWSTTASVTENNLRL